MGNTVFYNQLNDNAGQIGWKDIFSEYRKKHDKQDFDYALAAGTALNTASEEYMLQKWRKPWLFWPMLKWGLGFIALLYVIYFGLIISGVGIVVPAIEHMTIIIPPLVAPIIIMILFWEMNIPRNISIFELCAIWLVGGLISIVTANVLFVIIPDEWPACFSAPLAEEPAKLVAAILVMLFLGRNRKLYGISGFVVGAAVGAGFGAIESVQYAFSSAQTVSYYQGDMGETIAVIETGVTGGMIYNQIIRMLLAVGGHAMYCAPYAAEAARNSDNGKLSAKSFFNPGFISAFLISCVLHGLWDTDFAYEIAGEIGSYAFLVVLIVLIWIQGLRVLRMSLNQAVRIGAAASGGAALQHGAGDGATSFIEVNHIERNSVAQPQPQVNPQPQAQSVAQATGITLVCSSGELAGVQWQSIGDKPLLIGRDGSCDIRFSAGAQGVSGRHCSVQLTQFGWTVKDLGSSFGTFVSGGQKLLPGTEAKLKNGDTIMLGGNENVLTVNL